MVMTSGATMTSLPLGDEAASPAEIRGATPARRHGSGFAGILACVDGSPHSADVLAWAIALSRNLNAPLRTLHVLDQSATPGAPQDPLAWELRRREAQNQIQRLLENCRG
jgi:hypothetical protein